MNYIPMENDFIRSHNPHQRNSYTDGIVVDVDDGFLTFVVLSHVYSGAVVKPGSTEINCAPLNGRSIFDDPFHPRIERLGQLPSFSMTDEQRRALALFRAAREVFYPPKRIRMQSYFPDAKSRAYLHDLAQQLERENTHAQ